MCKNEQTAPTVEDKQLISFVGLSFEDKQSVSFVRLSFEKWKVNKLAFAIFWNHLPVAWSSGAMTVLRNAHLKQILQLAFRDSHSVGAETCYGWPCPFPLRSQAHIQ